MMHGGGHDEEYLLPQRWQFKMLPNRNQNPSHHLQNERARYHPLLKLKAVALARKNPAVPRPSTRKVADAEVLVPLVHLEKNLHRRDPPLKANTNILHDIIVVVVDIVMSMKSSSLYFKLVSGNE